MRLSRLFKAQEGTAAKRRRERGAAAVEFALIASVLMLLIFGGLQFGLILEMKNAVTQAASEGGRAAVVAPYCYQGNCTNPSPTGLSCSSPDGSGNDFGCVDAAAIAQANATVGWMNSHLGVSSCTSGGTVMQCQPTVIQCVDANGNPVNPTHYCLTMTVKYFYSVQPYLPNIPLLSALLPSQIPATVTVQLNDPAG